MAQIIQPTEFPVFQETEEGKPSPNEDPILGTVVIDPNEITPDEREEPEVESPDDAGEESIENDEVNNPPQDNEDFDVVGYFNLATSLGVLKLPEGFEFNEENPEESLQAAAEFTYQENYRQAQETLLNELQDPFLARLIEHGVNGGSFADLKEFFLTAQQELDYSNIDLSKEDNQVRVYKDYLNSTGKFSEARINQLIDLLQEDDELASEAEKARDYFIQESQKKQDNLNQQASQTRKGEEAAMRRRQEQFVGALQESGFSKIQQQKVLNSFNVVELDNGMQLRNFEKTLVDVQRNPRHFIELLTLLNEYDSDKGFSFARVEKQKETKATKAVLEKFKEAATHVSMNRGAKRSVEDRPIVPRDNPYVGNIKRY